MASFLLIHGAWHGGWCFDRLRRPLEAMGHSTAAPTLPGMGGGARALAGASLRSWAGFVVAEAGKLSGPVILCGHSRGGLVISQAAEQAPELFCDLVYISGALVPSGKSLYEVIGAGMEGGDFGGRPGHCLCAGTLGRHLLQSLHAGGSGDGRCAPAGGAGAAARHGP